MGKDKKLMVFDVDGTITPHGVSVVNETAAALCELERRGHFVAFASGKTVEYLDGLARGLGLAGRYLIAENGGVLYHDGRIHLMAERPAFFNKHHNEIERLFPKARMQHNMMNLTALATGETLEAVVEHLKAAGLLDGSSCRSYLHCDSVELLPFGVDKGRALRRLKQMLDFKLCDVIAVGNGQNDEPMRSEAGTFLAVGNEIEADEHFADTHALMAELLRRFH